jgi:hypothetical protein
VLQNILAKQTELLHPIDRAKAEARNRTRNARTMAIEKLDIRKAIVAGECIEILMQKEAVKECTFQLIQATDRSRSRFAESGGSEAAVRGLRERMTALFRSPAMRVRSARSGDFAESLTRRCV